MKISLQPLYFEPGRDDGFDRQLSALRNLFGKEADFLAPLALGTSLPPSDAVIFPQFLGEGYRRLAEFKRIDRPIVVITSEFGTLSMWDWELLAYLRTEGVQTLAPYSLKQAHNIIAALRVRRELGTAKFLVYQDNPGEGQQAPIFKRFYWWESECTARMVQKFGITIEKRSFKELGARAKGIPDDAAQAAREGWDVPEDQFATSARALDSATKLYLAVKSDVAAEPNVHAVGINCLNESHFSDTTPCLAFSQLYAEQKLIWGCEGDTVSMLTKYILHRSIGMPILMTNLYPFLLGNAALKHERISAFPEVKGNPRDYILVAHCGFMGVIPRAFSTEWKLREKVLGIVDENASAIDARIATGGITLAKISPTFDRLTVAEGELEGYAQYPGSDCRNGAVIHVANGHRLVSQLPSHHSLLMTGHQLADIETIAPVFSLGIDSL